MTRLVNPKGLQFKSVLIKPVLCYVRISYNADQRQVWKRQYMSTAFRKVILIPPGQSCLVFVYFENLWEVNTPCAQRLRQTTGVWYQAELKLCQHIQSAWLTWQRPPFASYLRHRHTVSYITHTRTRTRTRTRTHAHAHTIDIPLFSSLFLFSKYISVLKSKWVWKSVYCLPWGHVCLVNHSQRLVSTGRCCLLIESN